MPIVKFHDRNTGNPSRQPCITTSRKWLPSDPPSTHGRATNEGDLCLFFFVFCDHMSSEDWDTIPEVYCLWVCLLFDLISLFFRMARVGRTFQLQPSVLAPSRCGALRDSTQAKRNCVRASCLLPYKRAKPSQPRRARSSMLTVKSEASSFSCLKPNTTFLTACLSTLMPLLTLPLLPKQLVHLVL